MTPEPTVTVAIPTYRRAALLRLTLATMIRQDLAGGRYEVLVIDNNSPDDTPQACAEFAGAPVAVRHVVETTQGLDHARNRAIQEARGGIIVFADDDILVESNWLRELVAPLLGPDAFRIGAVGGEVVPVFPDGLPPWLAGAHRPLAFRADAGPLLLHQTPMGANLAIPRRTFEKCGTFSTALDRRGQALFSGGDGEMIRRIRAAGLEVWFAPAARALHQMPAARLTFRYATRHAFDSARSRVVDHVAGQRASGSSPGGYLVSRFGANLLKVVGFSLLALLSLLVLRRGDSRKCLVRAWRACGYLYQIPRSLFGRL